jgi:hypothetical protein
LVCTAGFREDGTWIRIYPVPFRKLDYDSQYKKYQWIELDLEKNTGDFRPESYRPTNIDGGIQVVGSIPTDSKWFHRKKICLKSVHTNLAKLIELAKGPERLSLAVFKPRLFLDFTAVECEREWDATKLQRVIASRNQLSLFSENLESDFRHVKKLPYTFKFRFEDDEGKQSTLTIEDWEIGQLFWKECSRLGSERAAIASVRRKYWDDFALTKDLYLFLGTVYENHAKNYPNPFSIIGTFHPPKSSQLNLF